MADLTSLDPKVRAVVADLAARFTDAGYQLHLVGGAVRDLCAGQTPGDVDLCTDATPDQFEHLLQPLGTVWEAGRQFGTLAVAYGPGDDERIEVTTFRTEGYASDTRRPEVRFSTSLTEDLSRRDFTVNAMAIDAETGEVADPFGGLADLGRGLLRTPSDPNETISEDPLRAVRAVRFSATRRWEIDAGLVDAIRAQAERLDIVSTERITAEVVKIFSADTPDAVQTALRVAGDCRLDRVMFGPFAAAEAGSLRIHPGAGVVAGFARLGIAARLEPGDADAAMRAMKYPSKESRGVSHRIAAAYDAVRVDGIVDARMLVRRHRDNPETVRDAVKMVDLLDGGETGARLVADALAEPGIFDPLPVDGHDLTAAGLQGPKVGEALRRIEAERCHRPGISKLEALASAGVEA